MKLGEQTVQIGPNPGTIVTARSCRMSWQHCGEVLALADGSHPCPTASSWLSSEIPLELPESWPDQE
jgi:hypothetical protein